MKIHHLRRACVRLLSTCCFALTACSATDDPPDTGDTDADVATDDAASDDDTGDAALPIAGEWIETFAGGDMQTHTITEATWTMSADFGSSVHHIDRWDVQMQALVAQSDAANAFNPGAWGKLQWRWDADVLYYCQIAFDAASAEDAWAAPAADADLAVGCGGFPWSRLDPAS